MGSLQGQCHFYTGGFGCPWRTGPNPSLSSVRAGLELAGGRGAGRVWQKLADAWGDPHRWYQSKFFRCFFHLIWAVFVFPARGLRVRPVGTPFNQKPVLGVSFSQNKFDVSAAEIKWISLIEYFSFVLCSWYQRSRVKFCLMLPKSL